ncbi:hypothetical protein B0H34DRAFT_235907 [Crassisporium funariophilum]|nr:hypothetical protein B0H34DRAFT_235907 [Crassisporium funariophilum]
MSGWGKGAPDRVGRQARIKSRAVREKQAQQVDDDPDDWFGNSAKRSIGSSRPNGESKKITFGKSIQDGGRKYTPPAPVNNPPSLLSRLGDDYQHQNSRSRPADRVEDRSHSSRNRSDRHARRPDSSGSSRYSDRRRQYADSGPRYKGGYAR